jgi:hypothetical protein
MGSSSDQNGLDDPMFTPSDVPPKAKSRWYLTTRGFWPAILIGGGWFVILVLRLIGVFVSGHSDWFNSILLVINGLLVAGYVPSIIHFARVRRARVPQ